MNFAPLSSSIGMLENRIDACLPDGGQAYAKQDLMSLKPPYFRIVAELRGG
jgi:hypothetical protein